jgi:hypothetical protein
MTASDIGINARLPQSAHLIRGFSQMPGRHSLGPSLALALRAASLCKFAILQICHWRTPAYILTCRSSRFPSAPDVHRCVPEISGETARPCLLSRGLMARVIGVQMRPWAPDRAANRCREIRGERSDGHFRLVTLPAHRIRVTSSQFPFSARRWSPGATSRPELREVDVGVRCGNGG